MRFTWIKEDKYLIVSLYTDLDYLTGLDIRADKVEVFKNEVPRSYYRKKKEKDRLHEYIRHELKYSIADNGVIILPSKVLKRLRK